MNRKSHHQFKLFIKSLILQIKFNSNCKYHSNNLNCTHVRMYILIWKTAYEAVGFYTLERILCKKTLLESN